MQVAPIEIKRTLIVSGLLFDVVTKDGNFSESEETRLPGTAPKDASLFVGQQLAKAARLTPIRASMTAVSKSSGRLSDVS